MAVLFTVNGRVTLQANAVQGEAFEFTCRIPEEDVCDGDTYTIETPRSIEFDGDETFQIPAGSEGTGDFIIVFTSDTGFQSPGLKTVSVLKLPSEGGLPSNEGSLQVNVLAQTKTADVEDDQEVIDETEDGDDDPLAQTTRTRTHRTQTRETVTERRTSPPVSGNGGIHFAPVITISVPSSPGTAPAPILPPAPPPPLVTPASTTPLRQPGKFEGAGFILWPLCIFLLAIFAMMFFLVWPKDAAVSQAREVTDHLRNTSPSTIIYIGGQGSAPPSVAQMCRHPISGSSGSGAGGTFYNAPCP